MKHFLWNNEKNEKLKKERGVSFEEVVSCIGQGQLVDIVEHPNPVKYRGQCIFVVNINNYAYWVPFVETETQVFLKTIIPNRKATRKYLKGGD
ncbi:MAG: BrnT family toxin [Candidatus Schekmanbacteria bacterium]|nr:BrnT family toxin [Candidatus Schekmanbacteria bacterium]